VAVTLATRLPCLAADTQAGGRPAGRLIGDTPGSPHPLRLGAQAGVRVVTEEDKAQKAVFGPGQETRSAPEATGDRGHGNGPSSRPSHQGPRDALDLWLGQCTRFQPRDPPQEQPPGALANGLGCCIYVVYCRCQAAGCGGAGGIAEKGRGWQ
jgi:hypothetical protein